MPSRGVVVARSASLLESAEQRAARQVAAAYNQARQELTARLLDGWTATGITSPEDAARFLRQSGLLQQVDARLQQLERELGITLRGIVTASSERAIDSIQRELALLPSSIRDGFDPAFGMINERVIEQFVPVAVSDWRGLTMAMSGNLQRELQVGLIQGEAYPDLVRRLLSQAPGEGAIFPRAQTSAELATRRLVVTAENGAKQQAIAEVAKSIPEIRKQALAAIGKNTTDCCLRVHGQIQPVSQPFELVGEPRFADELMTSPFHWNCRTGIVMHHPAFEESMPTSKLKSNAQRELARRKAEGDTARKRTETPSAPVVTPVEAAARVATRRAEVATAEADAARVTADLKATEAAERRRRAEEIAAAARAGAERIAAEERARQAATPATQPSVEQTAALSYAPSPRQLDVVEGNVDRHVQRLAQERRIGVRQARATVDKAMNDIATKHDLAIQFKSERLDRFLADPRFKTQFETNSSGGALDKNYRADAEHAGLGAPLNLDPKQRPIYGYVNLGKEAQDRVAQYGDITFILKDDVRQRTTITAGDSLYNMKGGRVAGTSIQQPGKASWDTAVDALYDYERSGNTGALVNRIGYAEIQIQGGVGIGDVRAVIDRTKALTARQRQRLTEMGIAIWDN